MTIPEMISTYEVCKTTPNLYSNVANYLARNIKDYNNPTPEQLLYTQSLIKGLVTQNVSLITSSVNSLGLSCYKLDNQPLTVFYRHKDISIFPVVLYWNFSENALPVFIEDPHNLHDLMFRFATRLVSKNLWIPRGMVSNACAQNCSEAKAPGQPTRSASDAAHSWWCLFRRISTWVYEEYKGTIPHIQIHGMRGADNLNMQIHNQYNANFTKKNKSICIELAKALAEVFPIGECNKIVLATKYMPGEKDGIPYISDNYKPGKAWFRHPTTGINTCVEARAINGGGISKVGVEDRGLFAHLELRTARFGQANNTARMDKMYKAIGIAVNNFMSKE